MGIMKETGRDINLYYVKDGNLAVVFENVVNNDEDCSKYSMIYDINESVNGSELDALKMNYCNASQPFCLDSFEYYHCVIKKDVGITVAVWAEDGRLIYFKMKMHTRMKKLIDAYCTMTGLEADSVRLMFENIRITPDGTPCKLRMQDEDEIEA